MDRKGKRPIGKKAPRSNSGTGQQGQRPSRSESIQSSDRQDERQLDDVSSQLRTSSARRLPDRRDSDAAARLRFEASPLSLASQLARTSLSTSNSSYIAPGVAMADTAMVVRDDGTRSYSARDRATGVQSKWDLGPAQEYEGRSFSKKRIRGANSGGQEEGAGDNGSNGDDDPNFDGYKPSGDPQKDYVFGRLIEILLVPPSNLSTTSRFTPSRTAAIQEGSTLQKRRFVVIRPSTHEQPRFAALPIKTYVGHGVAASGIVKWHHAIIYTRREPPTATPAEQPRQLPSGQMERPMQQQAIRVVSRDRTKALDPMARLDFFDVTELDDDVRHVKLFGKVHENSRGPLLYQYQAVWAGIRLAAGIAQGQNPHGGGPHGRGGQNPPAERAISIADLERWLNSIRDRARQMDLDSPPQLSTIEQNRLAESQQLRAQYLEQMQQHWRRQRANQEDDDDDDDDDDDEEEEEEEDDNDEDEDEDGEAEENGDDDG